MIANFIWLNKKLFPAIALASPQESTPPFNFRWLYGDEFSGTHTRDVLLCAFMPCAAARLLVAAQQIAFADSDHIAAITSTLIINTC